MAVDLKVADVRVHYGGVFAVNGVSLTVQPGEVVGLIGPNGAGKSSLLSAVSGDVRASHGSVHLGTKDVTRMAPFRRARLGMARTSQTARVFEGLTVFEGLVTAARGGPGASFTRMVLGRREPRAEKQAAARAWEILDQFGQQGIANSFGRELSGGQRRRIEIARALLHHPRLLLLDEPTVGLDIASRQFMLDHVRKLCREDGIAVLLATHLID